VTVKSVLGGEVVVLVESERFPVIGCVTTTVEGKAIVGRREMDPIQQKIPDLIVCCLCVVIPQVGNRFPSRGAHQSGERGNDVSIARNESCRLDKDAKGAAQFRQVSGRYHPPDRVEVLVG
jgi:hypothetical protein